MGHNTKSNRAVIRPGALPEVPTPGAPTPTQEDREETAAPSPAVEMGESVLVRMGGRSLRIAADPAGHQPRVVHGFLSARSAAVIAGIMAAKGFVSARDAVDFVLEEIIQGD